MLVTKINVALFGSVKKCYRQNCDLNVVGFFILGFRKMEVDTVFRTLQTLEFLLINKTVRETLDIT